MEQKAELTQQLAIAERIKELQLERADLLLSVLPQMTKLNWLDGAISELHRLLETHRAGE